MRPREASTTTGGAHAGSRRLAGGEAGIPAHQEGRDSRRFGSSESVLQYARLDRIAQRPLRDVSRVAETDDDCTLGTRARVEMHEGRPAIADVTSCAVPSRE